MSRLRGALVDAVAQSAFPQQAAFSRFLRVHRVDLEGQRRVDGGRTLSDLRLSQMGGERA